MQSTKRTTFLPVIDAHTHIFPNAIARKASENIGNFYGLNMYTEGTVQTLRNARNATYRNRKITSQVIFSPALSISQTYSINNFIAQCCSEDSTLIGFGTLHRDNSDYKSEIRRIKELGLVGLKFHPDFQKTNIDNEAMLSVYEEAALNNLPIIFHMGDKSLDYSSVKRLKNVMSQIPNLTVIAAHMGGYLHWNEALEFLSPSDNLYFDISSSLDFVSDKIFFDMLKKFGTNHFFFGSDFPMWNPVSELEKLSLRKLSDNDRRCIEYLNFQTFAARFGIGV